LQDDAQGADHPEDVAGVAPSTQPVSVADELIETIERESATVEQIPVHISYEIIRLFSEGLYQSPQKAVEELVSNGYDAAASSVHIILPHAPEPEGADPVKAMEPLWVIDNGHGLDATGFTQLWRVADSQKAKGDDSSKSRLPIGQFGIGKLAAYVLAWRLTHVSRVKDRILLTSMNFRRLAGVHQYDNTQPLDLDLRELTDDQAQDLLREVETRDPAAWNLMFGPDRASTWTAAGMSDFKNLYDKLSSGRLAWVLSTGLPLHAEFSVWLNGKKLASSKEKLKTIKAIIVGKDDEAAAETGLAVTETGVIIPGISGEVTGRAEIFESKLTTGKSNQYGRSHGFFVRVRGRVINLEDELFGLDALNHSAWARFSMEITADGLRDHLLSSREGVRESTAIDVLRRYLHRVFNACRRAYEEWADKQVMGLDVESLLRDAPSVYVTEPLVDGVRNVVEQQDESYYIAVPDIPEGIDEKEWVSQFEVSVSEAPIEKVLFEGTGPYDRTVRYIPDTRTLIINTDHPFIDKLISSGRNRAGATLFGSSELLVDVLMQEHGFSRSAIVDFLSDRDRVLRLVAGEEPSTAAEVLRLLTSAITHETALERAVGMAFRVLGFEYERRGGNVPGADGVLFARLGRGTDDMTDYKLVYDSKQTNKPAVPADKINIDSLEDFRKQENADFGFFLAAAYAGQEDPDSKLNRLVQGSAAKGVPATMLRVEDIRRLVELHYKYGVTLTRLRGLFVESHTVPQVAEWIDSLENELANLEPQVPLIVLLEALEEAKRDEKARPNVYTARMIDRTLREFAPERLVASLAAVQTIIGKRWIEVEKSGDVRLHHTADQIVAEVERHLRSLFGVDPFSRPTSKE
jgi:hypothetical protein